MELVNKCPYDLGKLIKLNTVCLDNEKIRKRINESQQIKIERVPSILVVDEKNGGIEKYEHSKALEWLNEVCIKLENKFNPPPPHPPPPPTQPQQVFVQPLPQKLPEPPTEQVYVSEPLPTPLPQQQEENKPQKNKKKSKKGFTSLDDINTDEEDNPEIVPIKKIPAIIRNDKNSFEISDFGDDNFDVGIDRQLNNSKRAIKKDVVEGIKSNKNISAIAMEIQKTREQEDSARKSFGEV